MNTNTTKLQDLYWNSIKIYSQIIAVDQYMRKLTEQGKSCIKTQAKYFELWDTYRVMQAEMVLLEADIQPFPA